MFAPAENSMSSGSTILPSEASSVVASVMENVGTSASSVLRGDVTKDDEITPIFLQTRACQGISGAFVWLALFLTCQQVRLKKFCTITNSKRNPEKYN